MQHKKQRLKSKKSQFLDLINSIEPSENRNLQNLPKSTQRPDKCPPRVHLTDNPSQLSHDGASPCEQLESEKHVIRLQNLLSIYKTRSENMRQKNEVFENGILELKEFLWTEPALKAETLVGARDRRDVLSCTRDVIRSLVQSKRWRRG